MNINQLAVYNSLYKIGLTDDHFKDIERELKEEDNRGIYIAYTFNKNSNKYFVGVSHDTDTIVIKQLNLGKVFKPDSFPVKIEGSRILFKTLISPDVPINEQIYTLHYIAQYKSLDTEINYAITSLEELKDRIMDRFIDDYPKSLGGIKYNDYNYSYHNYNGKSEYINGKEKEISKELKAIYWLFGEEDKFEEIDDKCEGLTPNLHHFIKVFERNNRRLAIVFKFVPEHEETNRGLFHRTKSVDDEKYIQLIVANTRHPMYDYIDEGREVLYEGSKSIWVCDELKGKITHRELNILIRNTEDRAILLTPQMYEQQKSNIRIELMNAKRQAMTDEMKDKMAQTIENTFKKTGKVSRAGITFTKESIECNGIKLSSDKIQDYLEVKQITLIETPNFNEIVEGFVEFLLNAEVRHGEGKPYKFVNLECNVSFEYANIKFTAQKRGNNFYINGHKICKDDILEATKKIFSFKTQYEYDEYLLKTSKINLRLQKVLDNKGLYFSVPISFDDNNILTTGVGKECVYFTLTLQRKQNAKYVGLNYTTIKGVEYKIKDINSFLSLNDDVDSNRCSFLNRTINLLYNSIEGITPQLIGEMIVEGKKKYKVMIAEQERIEQEKIARSKEFVKEAIRLTKAKIVQDGYIVKGQSKKLYFVEPNETGYSGIAVYHFENGAKKDYICIVDTDHPTDDYCEEALKNDRIAKRLLALSKDETIATEIDTLKIERGVESEQEQEAY